MKEEYRSRVYTDRPAYADFEPAEKFEAIKSIIAKRLIEHPNYQPKVYGKCFSCGSEIYDGDTAYNIDGTLYCEDCISNAIFTAEVGED